MGYFKRHSRRGSYDLFSNYSYYLPGFGGMITLFLLFILGGLLGNLLIMGLKVLISADFAASYGTVISYPVMFIPAMLYSSVRSRLNEYNTEKEDLDQSHFGKHGGIIMAIAVSLATIACSFVVDPISTLLPDAPEWFEQMMENLTTGPVWITLISVSIFAPFFEEWLCRGMVLRGLLKKLHPSAAIGISAAFFAILHMNPWQALPAFCLGLLFGYVYYCTGSLKLTILMHCVNNTMAVIFTNIPSLAEADSFMELMSPWAYICVMIAFILILASAILMSKDCLSKRNHSEKSHLEML